MKSKTHQYGSVRNKRNAAWAFADVTTASAQYLTHGYHRYPAKFIPQLVSRLIEEYSEPNNIVCDPFGGCGTTLVEAKLSGRISFGFDINPLAVLITQAKITAIPPDLLGARYLALCNKLENRLDLSLDTFKNQLNLDRLLYWFDELTLIDLLSIKHHVLKEKAPIRRFFLCSLSHILKNCSYWLTTSTKPQKDTCKVPDVPFEAFSRHTRRMVNGNADFYRQSIEIKNESAATMRKADARRLPLSDKYVDLVITSPPYSTSYEYADIHQLSALLFGFCTEIGETKADFIGSKANKCDRVDILPSDKAIEVVNNLRIINPSIARTICRYFSDMDEVYSEMYRVLKCGGRACVVIGDQCLKGVRIPNAEIAVEQMIKKGFKLERLIERPVPRKILAPYRDDKDGRFTRADNPSAKKIHSHEYILILRKK